MSTEKYGLGQVRLYNFIDRPFTGYNNWLKVWWMNKNPRLILGYYFETIREFLVPLIYLSTRFAAV
jgi:hypothetical protein